MTLPTPALLLGDRYALLERLAVGGMGEVWRARDGILGRSVAVKVLRAEFVADPEFRRRLRDEARHAAGLTHPHIAQVYDFDDGGQHDPPYLVMELVDGEPLSAILARDGPLGPDRTWQVIGQVASALAAAHQVGIVHRDIKPANLLVCQDGTVKVSDFGIARVAGAAGLTSHGLLLGTAQYLAPEQAHGQPATAASDFYALGVVAYECAAGHRPFDGAEPVGVLIAHRDQPVPALPATVPPALGELIGALLAKDPASRPQDGEAIAALAAAARRGPAQAAAARRLPADPQPPTRGLPLPPRPGRPGRGPVRRRAGWLAAGAAGIAVLLVLLTASLRGGGPRPAPPAPISHPTSAAAATFPVAGVQLFHPGGSADDHPEQAALAADGNPATAWFTQHYSSAAFGNLRPGVGLVFDLGRPVTPATLRLRLAVPGVTVAVYAGNDPGSLLSSPPLLTRPAAPLDLSVPGGGRAARYWLVWFSQLAPASGGYQAGIAEATFTR